MSKHLDRLRDTESAVQKAEEVAQAEATCYQPLFKAFQAVREATPNELGVAGPAFYQEWAARICRVGSELKTAGLVDWLTGRESTSDPTEAVAVEIYQLGIEGKKEQIAELLTETFTLAVTDADNQTKIRNRYAVNEWLRRGLSDALRQWLSHNEDQACSDTAESHREQGSAVSAKELGPTASGQGQAVVPGQANLDEGKTGVAEQDYDPLPDYPHKFPLVRPQVLILG